MLLHIGHPHPLQSNPQPFLELVNPELWTNRIHSVIFITWYLCVSYKFRTTCVHSFSVMQPQFGQQTQRRSASEHSRHERVSDRDAWPYLPWGPGALPVETSCSSACQHPRHAELWPRFTSVLTVSSVAGSLRSHFQCSSLSCRNARYGSYVPSRTSTKEAPPAATPPGGGGGQVFGPREGERPAGDSVELRSSPSAPPELLSKRRGSVRGRAGNRPSVLLGKLE